MIRLVKVKTCNLVVILTICLASCKDKQELGFLGEIEVGKYEITQYREYPNGFKDTLIYEAYGPWYQKGAQRYYFSIHESTDFPMTWEVFENGILFSYKYQADSWSSAFIADDLDIENDLIQMNYYYFQNNMTVGTDSINGQIIFKRIPQ